MALIQQKKFDTAIEITAFAITACALKSIGFTALASLYMPQTLAFVATALLSAGIIAGTENTWQIATFIYAVAKVLGTTPI